MTQPPVPVLARTAQALADANANPPFLYQLSPEEGRTIVDGVQADPPPVLLDADVSDLTIDGGPTGSVRVRIVRPAGATGVLPVILYVHGLGWVFGGPQTHDRLVRELAVGAQAAVVFRDYDLAPEKQYPTQIEQVYAVADWVAMNGPEQSLDPSRIAVAGDSVGGNMATVTALLAKQRGGASFVGQLLYYPVTDARFDTSSYGQFAEGYFLAREGMRWFWDQYTTDPAERADTTASPLRASLEELCRRRWSSWARPTCSATRGRPTPPSCARQGCRSPPCGTPGSCTTSSASTRSATPWPHRPPSLRG